MAFKNLGRVMAAALAGALLLTGCSGIKKDATLVTVVNGDKTETISLGYGNFVARYNQALYDVYYGSYMGEDMWSQDMSGSGSNMQDETKDSVLEEMETWYLCTAHASDYQVSLSDEDKKAIDDAAKSFMSANSDAAIDQIGATEDYVRQLLTDRTYATRVRAAIDKESEGKVEVTDDESKQSTLSYYLFEKGGTPDEADSIVEAVENAEATSEEETAQTNETALANAKSVASAEDFDKAGDGLDVTVQTHSFTTAADASEDGTLPEAVISAAKGMSEGQVSDVIDTDDGYYVIRLDKKYDKDATEDKKDELFAQKQNEYYEDILEGWKGKITWTVDDKAWAKVKFEERFSNGAPATDDADVDDSTEAE